MKRIIFSILLTVFTINFCHADIFPSSIDFGSVTPDSNVQPEVTIKNTSNEIWQIGGIGDTNPVSVPFSIFASSCTNSILQPGAQCSFIVMFSPVSEGVYTDSFNIEIINPGISYEVTLDGIGGPEKDEPDILVSFSSVNFGVVDVLDNETVSPYRFDQIVQNKGKLDLIISAIDISGNNAAELSVSGNCIGLVTLSPGNFCSFAIEFKPLSPGDKYAEISIISNDPDEAPFIIPVRGIAAGEDDGVPAEIEDAGPNNGDGNNDDILDSKQSNVVTLIDSYGSYVTYLTDNTYRFRNMTTLQSTEVATDFEIGSGIFDFIVEGLGVGESIEVGVILPAGMKPSAYYMYGPTVDNSDKHWFDFDFDGETGVFILGDVTFTTSSGIKFTRSVLKVLFKDGGRGDADLTENGSIAATSAMYISPDEGSASISFIPLLFLSFILSIARYYARVRMFLWKHHVILLQKS